MKRFEGGCLCGEVRYRAEGCLYPATFCHCTSCRRAAGAHVVAWFTVGVPHFHYTRGQPARYHSSPGVTREFCARCGTPLTYRAQARDGEIDLTIGSLDQPSELTPADHIWMADAADWDRPADGLPSYPGRRPG